VSDQVQPRFWFELKVRYADTDAQGHVYFANYLTYFDEAFTGYLHVLGCPPRELIESGIDVVYRDAHVEYLGRCMFEDVLRIGVRMDRLGNTSFTTAYVIEKGDPGDVVARGTLTNVCVDVRSMQKTPVPDRLREAVARYER
jgi:acyl-CoA thioester hydrolase